MTCLPSLRRSLEDPPLRGNVRQLIDIWRHIEYRIVCRRPADLEELPDLAVRIRGGFGRMLVEMPAPIARRSDPLMRPPPYAVLFADIAPRSITGLSRPFVIDATVMDRRVLVRLKVIGSAMFWAAQARDALIAALAKGIALRSGGRHRVAFEPVEIETEVVDGIDCPDAHNNVALLLRAPLVIRSGRRIKVDGQSLVSALHARVAGLARWQGMALDDDKSHLLAVAQHLVFASDGARPAGFVRHSQRQRGRDIPVAGVVGRIEITGPLEALMPYIAIGAIAHVGSHAGLGLGQYDLAVYE